MGPWTAGYHMISVENLSKSFGENILFDQAGFKINSRERVGLVGRNGHGKTTLFRILTHQEESDSGNYLIPKNYRIGYVEQHLNFTEDTVLSEGIRGLREDERDQHWKVEKILNGLGFTSEDMQRSPSDFSGGFQVRLNLAKALAAGPDLLLLDEPTNYLDISSIRWIEGFLSNWPGELMLITHDRSFMDKVVTHTLGIHRRKIRKIPGNTEKFYSQIALDEEIHEKTRINDEKKRKEMEQFITRFRAKARLANMVQSRVKTLSKMEKMEKLDAVSTLDFSFRHKPFQGKQLLTAEALSFGYEGGPALIKGLNIHVKARDRVCIIGKNGKGKTTLLKLLAGGLTPDTGAVKLNPGVETGIYEQTNVKTLNDRNTVEEELLYSHPAVERQHARNISGAMMFEGDAALKRISVLSGGEKSRVMLGKLLVTPSNLIFLDEPTNHLDMESCDSLLSAVDAFEGAVVMVTHNEMFLHAVAKRLIVFQKGKIEVFEGTYEEFLEKGGWEEEEGSDESAPQPSREPRFNKKELRKKRSEIITLRARALKPLEKKITAAEDEIEARETVLSDLNERMLKAAEAQDGPEIVELSRKIHECQTVIDANFDLLEELTERLDADGERFDKELAELEALSNG